MFKVLIETLKIFCDIVDLKSFSKAAEANYITQSAVSQQIRKLEKKWKTTFFERGRKTILLTRAGETLYQESKAIIDRFNNLNNMMNKAGQTLGGTLRIVSIHGVGLHELPPYIKKFMVKYRQVHVSLSYDKDEDIYKEVLQRKVDMGIVAFPKARPGINVFPFRKDELAIVCHPKHPLAKKKSCAINDINGMDFIAFQKSLPTRKVVDDFLSKSGVKVKITMEFDNIETLKRAVEIGAGIAIIPPVTIRNEIKNGLLRAVRISGSPLMRTLGVLVHKDRPPTVAVMKFLEILRSE